MFEENIKIYLSSIDTSVLVFDDVHQLRLNARISPYVSDLKCVVLNVLLNSLESPSYKLPEGLKFIGGDDNKIRYFETGAYKNRSSIDIWRHVKSIQEYADVQLSAVMKVLKELSEAGLITTLYCSNINRRVFFLDVYKNHISRMSNYDEFGIGFNNWGEL